MDNFSVNDYGWAHFYTKSKGITQGFSMFGTVMKIEKKYLLFVDNDDIEYYAERSSFKFERKEKPNFVK